MNFGGLESAFPYGYVMWLVFFVPSLILNSFNISLEFTYWLVIFLFDFIFLILLGNLFSIDRKRLLFIYWTSPIVVITSYYIGYNDLIPITIFTFALLTIKYRKN